MKRKILLMLTIVAILVCAFALSVSAETVLNSQDSNAYGDISLFDASIAVGRTDPKYGFTPYIDAEHTTYARMVVGDGTTFYTFPTAYALSSTTFYGSGDKSLLVLDMKSLNSAMEAVTGKNPGWTKYSIYRFEMPYNMVYVNGDTAQKFSDWTNIVELYLQPNSSVKDTGKTMIFWKCINLEVIHNLDTFVFRESCLGGSFEGCAKLTNITLGVSPEVTNTGDNFLNGCTALQSINFKEAFPNLKTIGKNAFYNCQALTAISTDGQANEFVIQNSVTAIGYSSFYNCKGMQYVSMPSALATIGYGAFQSCTGLKTLSLPATLTGMEQIVFDGCTSLLFVDFNDNQNVFNVDKYGQFRNCTSLLAVSLPDNFKYISNQMFKGCTSLKAVCLPANLTRIDTNSWSDDPFSGCTNMYFVQNSFEVVDENGNFYTAETFVQPERPDVYYMPESLSALCTNKTSGKCFSNSYYLNPVIVFGENMTKTTLGDGIFYECGNNGTLGSGITVVFLGDMEQVTVHPRASRSKGVKYVFANKNDKSLADVNIISNTTDSYVLNDKTEGFYFCNGNCYYLFNGVKYKGTYDDSVLTKNEGAIHFAEPDKSVVTPETCTDNRKELTYCFCNAEIGNAEVENTAYGHAHSVFLDLVYASFLTDGYYSYKCERCDDVNNDKVAKALFVCLGYSAPEANGNGFAIGYKVDHQAISDYQSIKGKTLKYGLFLVSAQALGDNDIFANDGSVADGVVNVEIKREDFVSFEFKLTGFVDEYKSKKLAVGAYAAVSDENGTEYSYMQDNSKGISNGKYYFVSYND
ncbi:MAG: leucine-rich repeat protein, partial [Clostridia bacterium]|nr:leucine-rich repeat protein [Clostridia bacterium]